MEVHTGNPYIRKLTRLFRRKVKLLPEDEARLWQGRLRAVPARIRPRVSSAAVGHGQRLLQPRRMSCLTIMSLAVCASGCAAIAEPTAISEDRSKLEAAIQRWERLNVENYSYDFQRLCNCSPEAISRVHIEVAKGKIPALTFAEDVYHRLYIHGYDEKRLVHKQGSSVTQEFADEFDDIVFMMQEMEIFLAKEPPPYIFEAVFDSEIGIPCRVYVDMSGGAIDEEVEFVVSNFSFVSEKSSLLTGCAAGTSQLIHFSVPD